MAQNFDTGNIYDSITGLLNQAGKATMDRANPMDILANMLVSASAQKGQQNLSNSLQGTQTMQQNPQFNPYQEGANKALKKAGEAHVTEAIQQGADPMEIAAHPMLQPDPTQMLQGLTGQSQQGSASGINKATQASSDGTLTPTTPIQQQASQIVAQPKSFMGRFGQALNNATGANQAQLDNLAKAQQIMGQAPNQGYEKALTQQIKQQINGLTPEQQASAIGNYNSALVQQHNELQKGITDQITATATTIEQLVKNTPILDKAPGSQYYETLKQLQLRLQGLTNQGKGVITSFDKLQLKNPNIGNKQSSQYKVGQTMQKGGKTYTYKGNDQWSY